MSSGRYARPEVKQITKQWVDDNCKYITERDMGLLQLLRDKRILRRDQIERMYPEFASTDRLNKRLKLLYEKHIIDRIYPPMGLGGGSSKQYICLDRAGVILLGLEKYNKPITLDTVGNRSLPTGWEHKVLLNDYECLIKEWVNSVGGRIIHYTVEKTVEFNGRKMSPDICFMMTFNGKGYTFYVEVDRGTEDIATLKGKVVNYHEMYSSGVWRNEEWCQYYKSPNFPRVIFSTNSFGKRIPALQKFTEASTLRFMYATHDTILDLMNDVISVTAV